MRSCVDLRRRSCGFDGARGERGLAAEGEAAGGALEAPSVMMNDHCELGTS